MEEGGLCGKIQGTEPEKKKITQTLLYPSTIQSPFQLSTGFASGDSTNHGWKIFFKKIQKFQKRKT